MAASSRRAMQQLEMCIDRRLWADILSDMGKNDSWPASPQSLDRVTRVAYSFIQTDSRNRTTGR